MPIPRERRVAILREWARQANPYLAGVFERLCGDIAAREPDGPVEFRMTYVNSATGRETEVAPTVQLAPRTLEDYMRPTHREPGEEG